MHSVSQGTTGQELVKVTEPSTAWYSEGFTDGLCRLEASYPNSSVPIMDEMVEGVSEMTMCLSEDQKEVEVRLPFMKRCPWNAIHAVMISIYYNYL